MGRAIQVLLALALCAMPLRRRFFPPAVASW